MGELIMNTNTTQKLEDFMEDAINRSKELNDGERLILSSYRFTRNYLNAEHLVIDDIVWEKDLQDLLNSFRGIDIDKIIITNTSTALMSLLHFLVENGCVIEGTSTVKDIDGYGKPRHGLLVKIN